MTILNLRNQIALTAQTLFKGESVRIVCPKCGGGSSEEKSFLCSRDHGGVVFYKCFRASCSYRGKLIIGDGESGYVPRQRKLHSFTRELKPLDSEQTEWWRKRFGINPDQGVYWCPSLTRDALRVYGPDGQHRGWVLRDWTGSSEPKVIGYPERDEPFIGWFPVQMFYGEKHPNGPCVVVEDLISARKVCDAGYTSVALNGTDISWEAAFEIQERHSNIELALDRGTMSKMIGYKDQFSTLFDNIRIWTLDEDLKYVSRDRIRRAFTHGEINFMATT